MWLTSLFFTCKYALRAWAHRVRLFYDVKRGRYEFFIASTPQQHQQCVAVLDAVRSQELNRTVEGSVLQSHAFAAADVPYQMVGCRDRDHDRVVACMRVTPAAELIAVPESREEYNLALFSSDALAMTVVFTRLAVLKPYRASAASWVLVRDTYLHLVTQGSPCGVLSCEPHLVHIYSAMGCQPFGKAKPSPAGGYRVPMICVPDLEYLRRIRAPFARPLARLDLGYTEPLLAWLGRVQTRYDFVRNMGVRPFSWQHDSWQHHGLLAGLSAGGRRALLQHASLVQCSKGDILMRQGDGGRFMLSVHAGAVYEQWPDGTVVRADTGEAVGCDSFVLDALRPATAVAVAPGTQVLLLSLSAPSRLTHPQDKARFWKNVALQLANKGTQRAPDAHFVRQPASHATPGNPAPAPHH